MPHSDFVHLHCHSQYSLLDAASKVQQLVKRAVELQFPALAITDHGNLFGAISFYEAKLDLSRYEYRLLGVLLEKPGRVWSREQLMERAWDVPEASLDRTVDAHIKSLRAKLRQVRPEVDAIVTHRGLGYALKEAW